MSESGEQELMYGSSPLNPSETTKSVTLPLFRISHLKARWQQRQFPDSLL